MFGRILLAVTTALVLACGGDGDGPIAPVEAQFATATVIRQEFTINWNRMPFIPCIGEQVHVLGAVSVRSHVTIDPAGAAHVQYLRDWRNVSVTGLTSGVTWHSQGMESFVFRSDGPAPFVTSLTGNVVFAPDTPGFPVIMFRGPTHVTVSATGEVTAEFDYYEPFICPNG